MSDHYSIEERASALGGQDFTGSTAAAGLPAIVLSDGPHGVRRQGRTGDNLGVYDSEPATCFPTGSAIASSWNPQLVREIGVALGREARARDVQVLLGPAVNLKRSPLGGRNFEYFSEDPLLAGVLGAEWVKGVQSQGVAASVKHFAVNNQETDRMRVSAEVDERTLRELYLAVFERIVTEATPWTVMSSYNAINGVYSSENRWLLTDLLRDEWGFDGLVVSDWGAIKDRVVALAAGLDLEMPSSNGAGTRDIVTAVREGRLSEDVIDVSIERLRQLIERTAERGASFDIETHHQLARRAAAESVVLLRNENSTLPLKPGTKLAVLGALAVESQFQGGGSSHVNPTRVDIPLEELRTVFGDVAFATGYTSAGTDEEQLQEARDIARDADVAIVFAGLWESEQSEGFDRVDLQLPAGQVELIQAVAAVAPRTVVVLANGGVVSLEPWHDSVDAIVEGWTLGQAIGGAITDVVTGVTNPSGRLAETIPVALADAPSYFNFPGEQEVVRYGEGVFVGYRAHVTSGQGARYPFGHGLSYTTFDVSDLSVEASGADGAVVHVTVTNTGSVAGADVVQVYVAPPASRVRRPVRELGAFAKVTLEPGESTRIDLELDRTTFRFWDAGGHRWWVEPGSYGVEIGRSATDIVARVEVELEGDTEAPPELTRTSTVKEFFAHPVVGPALMEGMLANATPEQREAAEAGADMLRMVDSMPMDQFARFPGVGLPDETLDMLIALSRQPAEV
ncbi:glycoside hydrolase family 3 C-terminal domain-containing protein [Nonomuraea sp. NPDC050022]|uniref:glycoside hydrolase family 3 C-terminal domain-containing protein n=1 Tax=unclassified Nonomuraea TaxID=2593643 RepID=UPI0033F81BFF